MPLNFKHYILETAPKDTEKGGEINLKICSRFSIGESSEYKTKRVAFKMDDFSQNIYHESHSL